MTYTWMLAAFAGTLVACSAGGDGSAFNDDDGNSGSSNVGSGSTGSGNPSGGGFNAGNGGGGAGEDCPEETKLVYVIDSDNKLYRFDPSIADVSAFTLIGTMGCTGGQGPNSMSVGRDSSAYVLYGTDDILFGGYDCAAVNKVSILDASCQGPSTVQCGSAGFDKYGMGFVSDAPGSSSDTLYLSNMLTSPATLGRVDLTTGVITAVGSLPSGGAEFTGNAKAELWGFAPGSTPSIIQIEKANGSALTTLPLSGLPSTDGSLGYAYAFAYWGGAFYVFYQVQPQDSSTNVYKVTIDGQLSTYIPNTGLRIVGAGVSTCAPVEPPD